MMGTVGEKKDPMNTDLGLYQSVVMDKLSTYPSRCISGEN